MLLIPLMKMEEMLLKDEKEVQILMTYLPQQMSEEEVTELVNKIVSEIPEADRTPKARGRVMELLKNTKMFLI